VVDSLSPPHQHGHDEEPRDEPQLLVPDQERLVPAAAAAFRARRGAEVPAAVDSLVEDVGPDERPRLGRAEVPRVVELPDPRGDLADLPAAEPAGDELPAALLLQAPQARVRLEGLPAVVVPAAVERQVPRARELAVRRLRQRLELSVRAGLAVGHRRRRGGGGGDWRRRGFNSLSPSRFGRMAERGGLEEVVERERESNKRRCSLWFEKEER
jgi:hypothetical protein